MNVNVAFDPARMDDLAFPPQYAVLAAADQVPVYLTAELASLYPVRRKVAPVFQLPTCPTLSTARTRKA